MPISSPAFVTTACLVLAVALSPVSGAIAADRGGQPFPDTHLRNYPFDPDQVYTVQPRTDAFTDFQVAPGEKVDEFYLSDKLKTRWRYLVSENRQHVLVKPVQANLRNTLLIITNRRTYQVTLLPSLPANSGATWDQRVTWDAGDDGPAWVAPGAAREAAAREAAKLRAAAQPDPTAANAHLESVHADYTISGTDRIRPVAVFDNGRITKLVFPATLQKMPMVLVEGADGKLDQPSWTVSTEANGDHAMLIAELFPKAILKLGDARVDIVNRGFPVPAAGAQVK